jgi:hypothetical protein
MPPVPAPQSIQAQLDALAARVAALEASHPQVMQPWVYVCGGCGRFLTYVFAGDPPAFRPRGVRCNLCGDELALLRRGVTTVEQADADAWNQRLTAARAAQATAREPAAAPGELAGTA